MPQIEKILEYNKEFVETNKYEVFTSTKYPNKKIAILSCMDTRLTELLPAALNLKNGDAKIIKNAGACIIHPFGSVMRSILVAIYELGVEEVLVIGHHDCGMLGMESSKLIEKMYARGITKDKFDMLHVCGIDINKWLTGINSIEASISETVYLIKNHPLIPDDINVYGFIMDPETGKLDSY